MERVLSRHLIKWLESADRKPLVIRGARQVGKTWLVRHLASQSKRQLVELNFEKQPLLTSLFDSNDPRRILLNLSAALGKDIHPETSLLFLDEIQAAPMLFSKLRWFAEDLPQLPVVAAGSLLEFMLAEHSFSMPVGRISYLHLEPLSFQEFLLASAKKELYNYLIGYDLQAVIPAVIHEQFMSLFKEYLFVGGLPAAVLNWITERSLGKVHQIQSDLLATYRDDFTKYKGRIETSRLDEVVMAIPKMLGQKFIFSRASSSAQPMTVKQILDLLEKARICHRVWSCSANGVPMAAEIKEKYFKTVFLDSGLCGTA